MHPQIVKRLKRADGHLKSIIEMIEDRRATAIALASFGGGSMIGALLLPRLLESVADRRAMLAGALILIVGLFLGAVLPGYTLLLPLWFVLGLGYALAQTPSGRLPRRSSRPEDRPALFAARFPLPHVCRLVTYPLAGWLGSEAGLPITFAALGLVAGAAVVVAILVWPVQDLKEIEHVHETLGEGDPHLADAVRIGKRHRHRHAFVIDSHHPEWPRGS